MRLNYLKMWAAAGLVLIGSASAAAADSVRVPGTRTTLQPPNGFSLADRFPGFQRVDLQSSIMVSEIPAPAADMMRSMTKDGLAKKGMTLISSKTEKIDGREALLLHVAQTAAGKEFLKWMLVAGDQQTTLLVVGTFPKKAADQVSAAVRSSVLSASWASGRALDHFEGLPFRVTPTQKLKVAGRMSNMVILTESGTMAPKGPAEALYIVGSSVNDAQIGDLRTFSEARARHTAEVKDIKNIDGHPSEVGELAAYELVADGKDAKTGTAVRLYQVIAPEGSQYLIIQGLVGADRAAELLPEFRRVTASLRRPGP